ncbi:MAG: rod shape-determining protein MreD [Myxococcales bacterium]|nr:rod shape-determining protein MreD [Myxococcales bacterium]
MNSLSQSIAVTFAVYLLLGIEAPLLQQLHLQYFAPDLALVAVLWCALRLPVVAGALTCLVVGFLKDGFVMGAPVGMHAEIFVILFLVGRYLAAKVPVRGLSTLVVSTVALSIAASSLFVLLSLIFDPYFESYRMVFRLMFPVALVTAPFSPVVFFVLDRVDALFARSSRRDGLI